MGRAAASTRTCVARQTPGFRSASFRLTAPSAMVGVPGTLEEYRTGSGLRSQMIRPRRPDRAVN